MAPTATGNMKDSKYIHELFEEVCALEDRNDRIEYLKKHAFKQAKSVLQLCYNDKIQLDLPTGKPPFVPCPIGKQPTSLKNAFSQIGLCVKGNKVDRLRKEKIFITILETITEPDAAILCAAKDGTLINLQNKKYRKMTKSLVQATFPEIL
jgi:hypothetical protein